METGRSSIRSHAGTETGSEISAAVTAETLKVGSAAPGENNVGLTVRLQQMLDKVQKEKDQIEKRLEELEAKDIANPKNNKQTVDMMRVKLVFIYWHSK